MVFHPVMTEQDNPFAPPSANLTASTASALEIRMVGSGRRFVNLLVDMVFYRSLEMIIAIILILEFGPQTPAISHRGWSFAFGVSIMLAYYISMEFVFGRTLGKWVTGTIVVNEAGRKPGLVQIVKRSFSRLIPFEPFSCFGAESRGWHDSFSRTYVVRHRKP
jgi:uncharacterized RDD family membrane protein YckC